MPRKLIQQEELPRIFANYAKDAYSSWLELISAQVQHASLGLGIVESISQSPITGFIYLEIRFEKVILKFNIETFTNQQYIKGLILSKKLLGKVIKSTKSGISNAERERLHSPQSVIEHDHYDYYTWDNFPVDECSFCGQWICLKPHKKWQNVLDTCDISHNGHSLGKHICDRIDHKIDILDYCYYGGAFDSNRRKH